MKIILNDKDWTILGSCDAIKNKNLLDTLTENDINIPYSCKMGVCSMCLCNIISWWEYIIKKDVMPTEDGMCLVCTAFINEDNIKDEWAVILQLI